MPLTLYMRNKMLNHAFNQVAWDTSSTSYFVKKHVGPPTDAGTASPAADTTRPAAVLSTALDGSTTLTTDIHYSPSAVKEKVTHVSVWDDATAGHCVGWAEMDDAVNLYTGDVLEIPSLVIELPGEDEDAA